MWDEDQTSHTTHELSIKYLSESHDYFLVLLKQTAAFDSQSAVQLGKTADWPSKDTVCFNKTRK